MNQPFFLKRESIKQVEEGLELAPKFDERGLIVVVTSDVESGEVLMQGYMNEEAFKKTLLTSLVHYCSRSRKKLWKNGETSGLTQTLKEIRIDDDQDSLWLKVKVDGEGASCHVGYRSCFYRAIDFKNPKTNESKENKGMYPLVFLEDKKMFDAKKVYEGIENPTKL